MVVKGVIGFRCDGRELLTYNGVNSHPEYLGRRIIRELKAVKDWNVAWDHVRDIKAKHQWDNIPGKELEQQLARLQQTFPRRKLPNSPSNYCQLLEPFRGSLSPYLDGKLTVLADSSSFLADRYYCEWAYIANLDDFQFEIWQGRQRSRWKRPRAGSDPAPDRMGLYPNAMIRSYGLDALPSESRLYRDLKRPARYPIR